MRDQNATSDVAEVSSRPTTRRQPHVASAAAPSTSDADRKSSRLYGQQQSRRQQRDSQCGYCGKLPAHSRSSCSARDATCRRCGKRGHFEAVCRSEPKSIGSLQADQEQGDYPEIDSLYIGSVNSQHDSDPWHIDVRLNDSCNVNFKIDCGADVTCIPESLFKIKIKSSLERVDRQLYGPDHSLMKVLGKFRA